MRRIPIVGNGGWRRTPLDAVARALDRWATEDVPLRRHLWWAAKRQMVSVVRRRATKLVHFRSPRDIARWLGDVTPTTVEVAD